MERFDVFSRFARVHLSTRTDRAVYLALVVEPGEWRSAPKIARATSLGREEVERVLANFEAAGLAERQQGPVGPRYRWRSDMGYLFGDGVDARWVDPVCGMLVTEDTPYRAVDDAGNEQRFCTSLCRTSFRAFPARSTRDRRGDGGAGADDEER